MRLTLAEIAQLVGGTLNGDGSRVIEGVAGLNEATEKDISFLGNVKYLSNFKSTRAGAVIVSPDIDPNGKPVIVLKNPMYGWAKMLEILGRERSQHPQGIHPSAAVAKSAVIGKNVSIGAFTVVEDGAVIGDNTVIYPQVFIGHHVRIGENCLVHPHATIREHVSIGNRCILHPGVVIGGDGFGFTFHEGKHYKVPQVGTVELGDDVEIQSNTTIDRAAVGVTKIGSGTKVDNLVQIAHNVEIGQHCLIVALTGIAGSVIIGNYVTLAAQTGVAGHLHIGDGVIAGARSGISHDIKPKEVIWGSPTMPLRQELKIQALIRKLPELFDEFKNFKKKLENS